MNESPARTFSAAMKHGALRPRSLPVEALEPRRLLSAYFVSAGSGLDNNPGTLARPFRTIQEAARVAGPGDTVFVRAGMYHETVTPARSGAAGAPITFEPYHGESVTVDGADPISGWKLNSGSTWEAPQGWDLGAGGNQVFLDNQMMTEARWPNTSLNPSHPSLEHTTGASSHVGNGTNASSATITDPRLIQAAGYWVGATIHIAPGQGWTAQTGAVTASARGSLTYSFTSYAPTRPYENPSAGNGYYLTGKFQLLDAPGEWYRDNSGHLFLRAPRGDSPGRYTVEAKHRLYAFDLSGRSYINVTGFRIFAATITTNAASSHLLLDHLNASYISHFTRQPIGWQQTTPHDSGIQLKGTQIVLQNSTIAWSAGDGVFLGGSSNTVRNCVIHDTDYNAGDWAPVFVLGENETVQRNTIYNSGRSGIVFRYSPRVQILNNVIHDVILQTTDGGALYTYGTNGSGSRIAYNAIYNIYSGGFGAAGVYLDNFSSNYTVDHNVSFNCGDALKLNPPSSGNLIYNNTFADSGLGLASSGKANMPGTVFANNIFTNAATFGPGSVVRKNLLRGVSPRFTGGPPRNYLDYRLAPGSPAINAGTSIPPFTNGFTGAAPDLGAFEAGVVPWSAGASV